MMPSDDQLGSNLSDSVYQRILSQFRGDWATRLNVDQMFVLIDGVLPFEACLYYQVLPLFLEGNRLHLGMVSLDDTSASEYVRRIVSYLNYSLVSHAISSEALRVVLTAYLNYAGNQPTTVRRESFSYGHYRHSSRKSDRSADLNERLTLVVDSPDDLYPAEDGTPVSPLTPPPPVELVEAPSLPAESDPVSDQPDNPPLNQDLESESDHADISELQVTADLAVDNITADIAANDAVISSPGISNAVTTDVVTADITEHQLGDQVEPSVNGAANRQPPDLLFPDSVANPFESKSWESRSPEPATGPALMMLNLEAQHLESPVEQLVTLPPAELLTELLARVLLGGIGRLYFEAYAQRGRVVWSQNGVLQSVLDQLPLPLFEGLIRELQVVAKLPPLPVRQTQQAEIEYLYERNSVLMRFRFMTGAHGEEATVQVLRGAALKFHQRQQLNRLERDAITMARQLQNKLNEIRVRAYSAPSLLETNPEKLPKLLELLRSIEQLEDDKEK